MANILVVGPHPDDQELGMGGTIVRLVQQGHHVLLLDMTDGEPTPYGILGVAVALVLAALIGVSLIQRRRAMAGKIRDAHQARGKSPHGSP